VNLKAFVFCVGIAAAWAATTGSAAAQWGAYGSYRYGPVALPAYAVAPALRAHGLRPVTQPLQTGRYIVVRAVDPEGQMVRVLINAEYGNILQVTPLPPAAVYAERGYPAYGPPSYRSYKERTYEVDPRYGAPRPDLKVEPEPPLARNEAYPVGPTGPTVIPAPRATPAPRAAPATGAMPAPSAMPAPAQQSAAVTPPRTPLPRARPAAKDATATAAAKPGPAAAAAKPVAPQAATDGTAPANKPGTGAFPPAAPLE
jgi:hypothetical protein